MLNDLPFVTYSLIGLNLLISIYGFRNISFLDQYKFSIEGVLLYRSYSRMIVSGFLHVDWKHLFFNMLTLLIFGEYLELSVGHLNFLLIFTIGLLSGNLFALAVHRQHADYSAVGASGAVSAILFAVMVMEPNSKMGLLLIPLYVPAWLFCALYVLMTIIGVKRAHGNIGHEAHLGGAFAGMLVLVLILPDVLRSNLLYFLLFAIPIGFFIVYVVMNPNYLILARIKNSDIRRKSKDELYNEKRVSKQLEIDAILDKINSKGMASLTKSEKNALEEFSKRN
ncbi:MAG TPA: rhomboid family intramembrane serine protease [Bacteroidia bacterium]